MQGSISTNNTTSIPTIAITSPVDKSTVTGPITITGTAQDTTSITKVEFYVDWSLHSTLGGSSPFSIAWTPTGLAAGLHSLMTMAYNAEGTRSCYAINVTTK